MDCKTTAAVPLDSTPKNGQADSSVNQDANPLDSFSLSLITSMSARIGAEAALEAAEKQRQKERTEAINQRYQDTKLLLQHYRTLNQHYANAIWENIGEDGEEYSLGFFEDIMQHRNSTGQVLVDSIKEAAEQTRTIMKHVNTMLDVYKRMCEESGRPEDLRRWRILRRMYLDAQKHSTEEIAKIEHTTDRTVRRDINVAIEELTGLLFGVTALDRLNELNKTELLETAERSEAFRTDPEKFLQSLEAMLPEELK